MSYNSTVDIDSLNIFNTQKYDQNPLYEKELRNIKYLPKISEVNSLQLVSNDMSSIFDILVDTYNAMVVRKDTNYYGMSRSKLNYPMNHSDVLKSYRNELSDYINLYRNWNNALNKISNKTEWSPLLYNYQYIVYNFTIPEIIRLNRIINLQISIPDDVPKYNTNYYTSLFIVLIGILICIIILILNGKNYYR